ncbi:MAG: hypothetical protein K5657_05595 [Desulfovibrio sp.]|nr:hypothetical protein [Desulfovibrio sp.]
MEEVTQNPSQTRFMSIIRIFSFDREKKTGVVLAKPFGWEGNGAVRIEGRFDERPLQGCALKVTGVLDREEARNADGSLHLDRSGKSCFRYVMNNACVKNLGREERLSGTVTRVFCTREKDDLHPPQSIALVHAIGARYPRKVFVNANLSVGDFVNARGVNDHVPAYRYKDGRAVEEIVSKDGRRIFNTEFHASDCTVRHSRKLYEGTVATVMRPVDEVGNCLVKLRVDSFQINRPVTAYLSVRPDEEVREGDRIRLSGYCVEKESVDREGRPLFREDGSRWTNLVIQSLEASVMREEEKMEKTSVHHASGDIRRDLQNGETGESESMRKESAASPGERQGNITEGSAHGRELMECGKKIEMKEEKAKEMATVMTTEMTIGKDCDDNSGVPYQDAEEDERPRP